jgi:protein phosphatase
MPPSLESMEDADQTRTRRAAGLLGRAGDLRLECASLSDVGRERSENQDACGESRDALGNLLVIVADGMGGHRGGSTASRLCIEAACREFADLPDPLGRRLQSAIEVANLEVWEAARHDVELEGMGTTAVALALSPDGESFVGWVGDSRAYRLRDGELHPITEDHSWIAEALRSGALTPEQAVDHPHRNQLLRCLGASDRVEIDLRPLDVRPGDRFLLCSDGLWGEVGESEIAAILAREAPAEASRRLVARANENGGRDNVTVQVVSVSEAHAAIAHAGRVRPARRGLGLAAAAILVALALLWIAWHRPQRTGGGLDGSPAASEPAPIGALQMPDLPPSAAPAPSSAVAAAPPPAQAAPQPESPRAAAPALAQRIEAFLDTWALAVTTRDFARYAQLGLPGSREQFEQQYAGRSGVLMDFDLLEHALEPDATVRARIRMSYGYDAALGRKQLETEYRIQLREVDGELRYAGGAP